MTVLVALTTEQEEKLRQAALQRGLDSECLLHEVVDAALANLVLPEPMLLAQRIPDLHLGQTWISDDFDDPLPDSFWFGEECALKVRTREAL